MSTGIVIAAAQVAYARVLAHALKEQGEAAPLTVLVLDDRGTIGDGEREPFRVVHLRELGEVGPRLYGLDPERLAELAKPWLLRRSLAEGAASAVLLEPETVPMAPLDDLRAAAVEHGVVLVPRLLAPLPSDDERPTEAEVLAGGVYRSGVLAVGNTEVGKRFVDWWSRQAPPDVKPGKDSAAPWALDLAPALFPEAHVLRDPGHGVAYWNLPSRSLDRDAGAITAAGQRLQSLYLPGFDPARPHWLSDANTRVRVTSNEVLAELCGGYSERLLAAGHEEASKIPWGYDELANGIALTDDLRSLLVHAADEGAQFGDPFTLDGTERFMAWLNEPAEHGGSSGVTRYLLQVYRRRADLRDAFPSIDRDDAERLVLWARTHGATEEDMPAALVPGGPVDAPGQAGAALGVNVAGYLSGGLGLGEAARLYVSALQAADVPLRTESVDPPLPPAQSAFGLRAARKRLAFVDLEADTEFPINLVCVNAPELPGFAKRIGRQFFEGRKTVAVWGWETSFIPDEWSEAVSFVDEIWTYSTYVASVLAQQVPVPVVAVPLPVVAPADTQAPLDDLALPDAAFRFLFAFDFFSTIQRKNPLGLVEAFKRAFRPGEGPQLVLKSFNGDYKPEHLEKLRYAARGRSDIQIVDRFISVEQRNALMASADCYVSLHRSEGFGLTLAEAMALGKPVIATGYSGNLDFMDPSCAYLVGWEPVEVGAGVEIYPAEGVWADPDLDHAAELMRRVVEHPDEAAVIAARGRHRVESKLSPEASGAIARARLERLATTMREQQSAPGPDPAEKWPWLQAAADKVAYDPSRPTNGGARDLARRSALQAMRPYTHHQGEVNERMLKALHELHERVDRKESIIRRIERQARHAERESRRMADNLQDEIARLAATVDRLEPHGDDLDRIITAARTRPGEGHPLLTRVDASGAQSLAFGDWNAENMAGYSGFEDIFRGEEEEIAARLKPYLPLLREHGPVLDVGCGRGELLALLGEAGIAATGVDIDTGMVERCRALGLEVLEADGVEHLASLQAGSLGAVSAIQVVEHLPYAALTEFLRLARERLTSGGALLAETVNPHSPAALKAFWTDPTHQHPLFPETLLALCRLAGFASGRVLFPGGTGQLDPDVYESRDYAVVAHAP